ncbi:hypothetical protein [Streptomyces fungicidicus]
MRRPVAGEVHVHYSQIYIESDPDSFGPDLRESFAGQSAGLCGAATPGALWLSTGLHTGSVGFSVEVLDQAPPLDPAWEDVVEVSFRPVSAGSVLVQWAGAASWDLGARRLADSAAHPRLAAALAAALFTGASFQQLATTGPRDYDDAAATLALHDRARYTDGCAAHPVPGWARVFLRAAACFARLVPGDDQALLAAPGDRTHLLSLTETARLRPPQPPAASRTDRPGRVEWDWREQQEAKMYDAMLGVRQKPLRD